MPITIHINSVINNIMQIIQVLKRLIDFKNMRKK